MLFGTIAATLGYVALSADMAVVVAAEALYHSAGAVVELALVYLALLCQSCINDSIGYLWVCEFYNNRRCMFEHGFLGQLSYV